MPLDTPSPLGRTAAITDALAQIGRVNGTMMPKSRKRGDAEAYEFFTASLINQLNEARRNQAKKALIAKGIMPDYSADPLPAGTVQTVFSGDVVSLSVKVVEQAARVNVAALVADLEKAGFPPGKLKRLIRKHTTAFNGAHIITASLVV
jgi:hypothetical protein